MGYCHSSLLRAAYAGLRVGGPPYRASQMKNQERKFEVNQCTLKTVEGNSCELIIEGVRRKAVTELQTRRKTTVCACACAVGVSRQMFSCSFKSKLRANYKVVSQATCRFLCLPKSKCQSTRCSTQTSTTTILMNTDMLYLLIPSLLLKFPKRT